VSTDRRGPPPAPSAPPLHSKSEFPAQPKPLLNRAIGRGASPWLREYNFHGTALCEQALGFVDAPARETGGGPPRACPAVRWEGGSLARRVLGGAPATRAPLPFAPPHPPPPSRPSGSASRSRQLSRNGQIVVESARALPGGRALAVGASDLGIGEGSEPRGYCWESLIVIARTGRSRLAGGGWAGARVATRIRCGDSESLWTSRGEGSGPHFPVCLDELWRGWRWNASDG
jgi:hypothetical protein